MTPAPLAFVLCGLLMAAPQTIVQAPTWHALPSDVSGPARGLYAQTVDAAAAGELQGFALQLRHVGTPTARGTGALALSAGAPLGPITLGAGYAWANLPDPKAAVGTVNLSLRLHERWRLGVSLQRYKPLDSLTRRSAIDAGVLWQPHRMLSVSLGSDALNAPGFSRRVRMRRALRLGLGFRPLSGSGWLTLGADARFTYAAGGHLPDMRALVDVSPYEGLHLLAHYRRSDGQHTAWAGISLDLMGVEVMGAHRAVSPVPQSPASRMAWALTLQQHDSRALPLHRRREVHLDVAGDLRPQTHAPWQSREAIAVAPARLAQLADVPDVARVVLHLGALEVGYGTVGELRAAIARLRSRGIEVTAHLQVADSKSYLVAAAADHITMDPIGTLDIKGPSLQHYHLAEALGRVGITVEAVAVGRYKSAPDTFTKDAPTPEQLQVSGAIVQQLYGEMLQALIHDRGLSEAASHAALAAGPLGASGAKGAGLIDEVAVRPGGQVREGRGTRQSEHPRILGEPPSEPVWGPGPRIALIALSGMLVQEGQGGGLGRAISARAVIEQVRRAQEDATVRGVVVRIDSPGGDVVAAEEVYRALRTLAKAKPVAVSMGDVAASGGYWAALAAPKIFAQPMTLTGSIGIYSLKLDASGVLHRLGVHESAVGAGERAGAGAWQRPMGEDERAAQQRHLDDLYALFVDRVAARRKLTPTRAQELAQGRVYTGAEAQQLHLVDAIGGLEDAIAWVAHEAGVADDGALTWRVPKERSAWPVGPQSWAASMVLTPGASSAAQTLEHLLEQRLAQGPQALAPLWVIQGP